jgi:hypothetical protein
MFGKNAGWEETGLAATTGIRAGLEETGARRRPMEISREGQRMALLIALIRVGFGYRASGR